MENEVQETSAPISDEVVETTNEETPTEGETPQISHEEIAELKKKAELAENYKIRAEKAEKKAKESVKKEVKEEGSLSPKDYLALTENKITSDDFDTVVEWAKFKKISVHEAVKDKTLKTILNEKAEERKTAEVTNVKGGQRGSAKPSYEALESEAEKGSLKETDIEALTRAKWDARAKAVER